MRSRTLLELRLTYSLIASWALVVSLRRLCDSSQMTSLYSLQVGQDLLSHRVGNDARTFSTP